MNSRETIGVIPAAGAATRLWHLPGSKELLPVGFESLDVDGTARQVPKVISSYLIDQFLRAGVAKAVVILTDRKLDILHYYGGGHTPPIDLGFLLVEETTSMPHSIARAHNWCTDQRVVFGMPDTMFMPPSATQQLLSFHVEHEADLSLGLFPTQEPWRFGMVQMGETGRVVHCIDKPNDSTLKWLWGVACWEPRFFDLLEELVSGWSGNGEEELVLGDVFQTAIDEGLEVYGLPFEEGAYYDIGTPESYAKAVRMQELGATGFWDTDD